MIPNHLELKSADGTKLNLEALYRIAPSCFTEVKDEKTGELRHVVNFTTLRQLLGDDAVEDAPEMYQFTWPGKQEARREAARPITDTLRPCPEESVDWDTTQNLYIEGDNLAVLKLLQKGYMGKVKMIYIDPPYNTGNDFVYHDNFAVSQKEMDLFSGNVDEEGNRYRKNTDSNGRFHSDWCSMMYARLLACRSLLKEDGAILVSIDRDEISNLLRIMNDVFGEKNYIDTIIWDKKSSAKGVPPQTMMVNVHEYIVAYSKGNSFTFTGEKRDADADGFKNPDNDPRGPWRESNIKSTLKSPDEAFTIVNPETGKEYTNTWAFSKESLERMIAEKRILWKESLPKQKEFLFEMTNENKAIKSNWGLFDSQSTTVYLKHLIPEVKFDNPKPIKLMEYLLDVSTQKDDIILDFFSGSATTAHALMNINLRDEGRRKFILVQIQEEIDKNTDSYKAGYHTICDIGKERIRKCGKEIKEEAGLLAPSIDVGFRVLKLSSSNFNEVYFTPKEFTQDLLSGLESNIKEGRTDLDLLFGAMLDWGVQLSLPMSKETVDGCDIYTVNEGDLVACFSENVTENVVSAMAAKMPLRVLFRDSCFSEDKAKINVFELFKQKLDWGEDEAIKNIRVI